jgi:hypothetical protein
MPHRTKQNKAKRPKKGLALAFIILFLLAIFVVSQQTTPFLRWISPGWEIYDQVGAIRSSDQIYSQSNQFTSPRELMGVYWKVDVDDPYYGVPTIMVELGDIHHVDFTGREIPSDQVAATMTVTRGNNTFYLDYHIYTYTVTIRTIADKKLRFTDMLGENWWSHETMWPYEGWGTFGGFGGTYVGQHFTGGVYTKFVINPWKGVSYHTPPNSSYVLDQCWAGVMNTYILKKQQGQVANQWGQMPPPSSANFFIGGGLDEGNQVPMFEDDGTFADPAPSVNWGSDVTPDVRIESTVVHYLPVDLGVGASCQHDWDGDVTDISPLDVAVMYTLRVDVLQTHEFTLQTAIKPPEPTWPTDYFSWAVSFWQALLGGLNPFAVFGAWGPLVAFLCLLAFWAIGIIVCLAIFAPTVLTSLFGAIGKSKRAYKEGFG